jgi:hypothetical protein
MYAELNNESNYFHALSTISTGVKILACVHLASMKVTLFEYDQLEEYRSPPIYFPCQHIHVLLFVNNENRIGTIDIWHSKCTPPARANSSESSR